MNHCQLLVTTAGRLQDGGTDIQVALILNSSIPQQPDPAGLLFQFGLQYLSAIFLTHGLAWQACSWLQLTTL